MRRFVTILALTGAAALLAGCVYDPYTGAMVPCCGYYGNPYYRSPGPYSPYGYPPQYGAPQGTQPGPYQGQPSPYQAQPGSYPAQPGTYQGQPGTDQGPPPPPYSAPPGTYPAPQRPSSSLAPDGALAQRFAAANVTHDGRLTRQQAQPVMPRIAENFDAIDLDQKGYVTLAEIQTFIHRQQAAGGQVGQFDQD